MPPGSSSSSAMRSTSSSTADRRTAARPSTVVDCSGELPRVVREGAIPAQRIEELLAAAGLAIDVEAR